jgi:protein-tyrosine phosphatase
MNTILFVCMGNICRSPVAEAVARAEFARAGIDAHVASAGTGSWHAGDPADQRSRASAAALGYDLSAHRARGLLAEDFARYDWLLAMDRQNLAELLARCPPHHVGRVSLYLPFAGVNSPEEIADPYYGGPEDFARVVELARAGAAGLVRKLVAARQLSHNGSGLKGTGS